MTARRPLVVASGTAQELPTSDSLLGGQLAFTFSYTGTLATATGTSRLYNPTGRTLTIDAVVIGVGTSPTTQSVISDLNLDGTTAYTTQGNRPAVTAGNNHATATAPDVTTWGSSSYLTVDIDQVGSGTAGSDLTLTVVAH